MSVDIKVKRADRAYFAGETVSGVVEVDSPKGGLSHSGIKLSVEGVVTLLLGPSLNPLDAFGARMKTQPLLAVNLDIAAAGRLPDGVTKLPFEFKLEALADAPRLHETYHGVYVSVEYFIRVEVFRSLLAKNLKKSIEFIVLHASSKTPKVAKTEFVITPESLRPSAKAGSSEIPRFRIAGHLATAQCDVSEPLTGEVTIHECDAAVQSVELHLYRIESVPAEDGVWMKEASLIQNIQIADGDVVRNQPVPVFMVFPRLFTCPSVAGKIFKLSFEVQLVVVLRDGHQITESLPIKLLRQR